MCLLVKNVRILVRDPTRPHEWSIQLSPSKLSPDAKRAATLYPTHLRAGSL
jgi:hypothetical protein